LQMIFDGVSQIIRSSVMKTKKSRGDPAKKTKREKINR